MRKALVVSTILVIIISLNIGCKKYDLDGYNYDVQRSSTSKNIIFFEDNSIIYGIDTLTKSYEVIISVENMDIGGVAKLPSGGIVFTSRGNTNNAIGYGWMYITDNQFNIIKKIDLNGFPEGPAVDGNHILVSVNCISNNSEKVLQIFNSRNYALVKHVTTQTIVYAVDIKSNSDYYFANTAKYHSSKSHILQIDKNDFTTIDLTEDVPFFMNTSLSNYVTDSFVYVFSEQVLSYCKYDIQQSKFIDYVNLNTYSEMNVLTADGIVYPRVSGDYIYGLVSLDMFETSKFNFFKFNMKTLSFDFMNEIELIGSAAGIPTYRLYGNKIYIFAYNYVYIVDYNTGMLISSIELN